jgi:hypothetical protein
MNKFWVGKAKCCGAISAAMVADEKTTNADIADFAIGLGDDRTLELKEVPDGSLSMARCKCSQRSA